MCIICIEFIKGKLTKLEAQNALNELILTDENFDLEHVKTVDKIINSEDIRIIKLGEF